MIVRVSITQATGAASEFFWMVYSWRLRPELAIHESLEHEVLAEGTAPTRDATADAAIAALDAVAPGAPIEDRVAATKKLGAIAMPGVQRERRWLVAYLSPGTEAKARLHELAGLNGFRPSAFVQSAERRLWARDGDGWRPWVVTGEDAKRVHVIETGADGLLAADGNLGSVDRAALKANGRASCNGIPLFTGDRRRSVQRAEAMASKRRELAE